MEKLMTYETLRQFAYSNDAICRKPPRGIVLSFYGLNGTTIYGEDPEIARELAQRGIILVYPYTDPWGWMNRQQVGYTDEIVAVLTARYGDLPVVSTGGSMGGLAAITYCRYAARTPVACVANCPVCDLPYHFTERPDLPRTLYNAFYHEEGPIGEVLRTASPLHLADSLPRIPYRLFHCEEDRAVNLQKHSETFVAAMQAAGQDIRLVTVPGRGHCDLTPEAWEQYYAAIEAALK